MITINSTLSKNLRKIADIHFESGMEANSKIGFVIADNMKKSLRNKKTFWTTERKVIKQGKNKGKKRRVIKKTKTAKPIGLRYEKSTGKILAVDMANFITFRTYATTGTTIVGGLSEGGFTEKRRNGKVVGRIKTPKVGGFAINTLKKLNSGNQNKSEWYDKDGKYSTKSIDSFNGKWRGLGFAEEGRRAGLAQTSSIIKTAAENAKKRAIKYA